MGYCTRADLYRYGLPRGLLGANARQPASVDTTANVLELDGHGFETGDQVIVRALEGGSLAAPLSEGATYYVIRVSDSQLSLAATALDATNNVVIDLTTTGSGFLVAVALPLDEVIEFYSAIVDGCIPAHAVPLTAPYPVIIVATVAELAAKKLAHLAGRDSGAINEAEKDARARITAWAAGLPVPGALGARTNKAVSSVVTTGADPRGWGSGSLP